MKGDDHPLSPLVKLRRVVGTEPVNSTDSPVCRESEAAASNHHSQQRVTSPRQAICKSRGDTVKGWERRGSGEGVASGVIRENQPCKDGIEG